MDKEIELAKIRWACRRGMLELDLLLGDFFAGAYRSLSESQQAHFRELLSIGDQDLFDYFLKDKPVEPAHLQSLVYQIKQYAADSALS